MGIHLSVMRKSTRRDVAPEVWDCVRYAGDREFCDISLPMLRLVVSECEFAWRPLKFDMWRDAVSDFPFQDRHRELLDLLEQDEDLYYYVG